MDIVIAKFGAGTGLVSGADAVPLQHWAFLPQYNGHGKITLVTGLNLYTDKGPDCSYYPVISKNGRGEELEKYDNPDALLRAIGSQSCSIIHTHTRGKKLVGLVKEAKKRGAKHIHTMHGMDSLHDSNDRELFETADLITSPSQYSTGRIEELDGGKYAKKTLAFPNSTNFPDYKSDTEVAWRAGKLRERIAPNGEKIILASGRLQEDKGVFELGEAVAYMAKGGQNVKLVHAGMVFRQEDEQRLRDAFRYNGVEDRLVLLGAVNPSQDPKGLPAIYKAADVFVLPSDTTNETFGITPLEALSLGVPVIVSSVGGTKEVYVDTGLAIGVTPRHADAIGTAIEYVLSHYDAELERAKIGSEVAEKFYHSSSITWLLHRVYEKLIAKPTIPDVPRNGAKPSQIQRVEDWVSRN